MTQPANTEAIEKGTGKSWAEWLAFLDAIDARALPHKEIARRIVATGNASGWWAQGITVAYEQHIGRRVPGQRHDGMFELSVTRTLPEPLDAALDRWLAAVAQYERFGDMGIAQGPEISRTEKARYWRCGLADGSRVAVHVRESAPGKTGLAVVHEKLKSQTDITRWRAFWKGIVAAI